jgi:acyl carrier protein
VRGYRVETGDVEAKLLEHPGIKEAAVIGAEAPGVERLVAYFVPAGADAPGVSELRAFLKKKLPDYMVPSAWLKMTALPRTPGGKLDRNALPAPDRSRPEIQAAFAAPDSAAERELAQIWAETLGLERVGIHEDFFELGGHSLAATKIVSRIHESFQVELPLRTLFENPTVAGLAVKIAEAQPQKTLLKEVEDVLAKLESLSEEEARRLLAHENSTKD